MSFNTQKDVSEKIRILFENVMRQTGAGEEIKASGNQSESDVKNSFGSEKEVVDSKEEKREMEKNKKDGSTSTSPGPAEMFHQVPRPIGTPAGPCFPHVGVDSTPMVPQQTQSKAWYPMNSNMHQIIFGLPY